MRQVTKDVYHISLMPRNSINCYIVEGVLIDSGIRPSFNTISNCLKEIPVHSHALTHAHADHQGCSDKICSIFNVPLFCHKEEVWRTESGFVTKDYPSSKNIIARLQQKYWAGPGHQVSETLKEDDMLGNFKIVETPGHSAGHISFFREKDGVLIIGDVCTNMNLITTFEGLHLPPDIFTSDKQENVNSLRKLAKLNPRIICFGHGPVLVNKHKSFEKFVEQYSR
jgi:glyoxylase-like metal-dependent hydrolase (beta-lactamase superfamily II)